METRTPRPTRPAAPLLALVGALLLVTASCGSCKETPPPKKKEEVAAEVTPPPEEAKPYMKVRQAYGVPVPPEVVYLKEMDDFIEVGTRLRLDELRSFFEERLVDYEFIERDKNSLRLVGLRSGMPTIWIDQGLSTLPVKVLYVRQAPKPAEGEAKAEPKPMPRKGEAVDNRLPNGELVAPGARWGEPYVPPVGSPLHQPRYRANFGKPFGTWVLN